MVLCLTSQYELTSWYAWRPANFDLARAEDLFITNNGDAVITGCIGRIRSIPTYPITYDQDRLLYIARVELPSNHEEMETSFLYAYQGGELDDDGYTLIPSEVEYGTNGYMGFGYHQCDLSDTFPWSPISRLLVVGVEESYDSEVFTILTGNRDWNDEEYRDAIDLGNGRWSSCGWFYPDHTSTEMQGFVHYGHRSNAYFAEDDNVHLDSWEKIARDDQMAVSVLGGLGDSKTRLYCGIHTNEDNIVSAYVVAPDGCTYLEGSLQIVQSGVYLYSGIYNSASLQGITFILWGWDGTDITIYDNSNFNTATYFSGYSNVCPKRIVPMPDPDEYYVLCNAYNVNNSIWGVLIAKLELDNTTLPPSLDALTLIDFCELDLEFDISEVRQFHVIDNDDLHVIGAGGLQNNTVPGSWDWYTWVFEIAPCGEDDWGDSIAEPGIPCIPSYSNVNMVVNGFSGVQFTIDSSDAELFIYSLEGRIVYRTGSEDGSLRFSRSEAVSNGIPNGCYIAVVKDQQQVVASTKFLLF